VRVAAAPSDDGEGAAQLARGTGRLLADMGFRALPEVGLGNGRRADLLGLDGRGRIVIVEIKRSAADFRADRKWPEYVGHCDFFYFAVPAAFPSEILPDEAGLIVADRFGGAVLRPAPERPVHPSRRRSLTLRFALAAAERFRRLTDPEA